MKHSAGLIVLVSCIIISACGGGGGSTSAPTTPTPVNQNPVINSLNFSPLFGIQQLTTFAYSASASDSDGDSITYNWDIAGNQRSGTSGSISFSNGGTWTARLTVTDGKGGTTSDTRTFTCGSMTGTWKGTFGTWLFTSNLQQNGGVVTGDYSDQLGRGQLDPASANTINSTGAVVLRYKQSVYSDFSFRGQMEQTGTRITGQVTGSGYNGEPFVMTKQ